MGTTDYEELTVDAIVMGAAEKAAQRAGLVLDPGAKTLLLNASLRRLDAAHRGRALEERRAELEENTARLVRYIAENRPPFEIAAATVTFTHMNDALAAFCRLFPNFYPFCPYP